MIATVVMAIYSWQLTIVVWVCFLPLFLSLRFFQRRLSLAYGVVRQQVGVMLSAVSEPVVGAATVRSYAIEDRTQERIDTAIERYKQASTKAQGLTAFSFSLGGVSAGLANAGVRSSGCCSASTEITAGEVLAFAFLVTLFVGPVQIGTQVLTDAQNAIAGWRRVIGILDTPADVADPGESGRTCRSGPSTSPSTRRVRLPGRPARAARRRPRDRARHPGRGGGRDRLGQDHVRQAADPASNTLSRPGHRFRIAR